MSITKFEFPIEKKTEAGEELEEYDVGIVVRDKENKQHEIYKLDIVHEYVRTNASHVIYVHSFNHDNLEAGNYYIEEVYIVGRETYGTKSNKFEPGEHQFTVTPKQKPKKRYISD